MKYQKLGRGYKFTPVRPYAKTKKKISMRQTARDFARLIEEDFDGLCHVNLDIDERSFAAIYVSHEYTAYLFRCVMYAMRSDEHVLNIEIKNTHKELILSFTKDENTEIGFREYDDIMSAAEHAGFEVLYENGGNITLRTPLTPAPFVMHSIPERTFYEVLSYVFYK